MPNNTVNDLARHAANQCITVIDRTTDLCETREEMLAVAFYVAVQVTAVAGASVQEVLPSWGEMPMNARISILGGSMMANVAEEVHQPLKAKEITPNVLKGTTDFFAFMKIYLPEMYEKMRQRALRDGAAL